MNPVERPSFQELLNRLTELTEEYSMHSSFQRLGPRSNQNTNAAYSVKYN